MKVHFDGNYTSEKFDGNYMFFNLMETILQLLLPVGTICRYNLMKTILRLNLMKTILRLNLMKTILRLHLMKLYVLSNL